MVFGEIETTPVFDRIVEKIQQFPKQKLKRAEYEHIITHIRLKKNDVNKILDILEMCGYIKRIGDDVVVIQS